MLIGFSGKKIRVSFGALIRDLLPALQVHPIKWWTQVANRIFVTDEQRALKMSWCLISFFAGLG